MRDISLAIRSINDRHDTYANAETYYNGSENEVFAHARFAKLFGRDSSDYILNYCKTVVDTVNDRLEIAAVLGTNDSSNDKINEIWEGNELTLDQHEIHRHALVFGECYAIVWPDEEGEVQITYNSPLTTVMIYDQENPRKKSFAAKLWQSVDSNDQKWIKVNLYYADRIDKFITRQTAESVMPESDFTLIESIENPYDKVPVFHFRTQRPHGTPEHAAAIGPQDAINKLVANHMYTVDYQGAPQRYALTKGETSAEQSDFADDDTDRENIRGMHSGPGQLWYLKGVDAVGSFPVADPKNFTGPVISYVNSLASLTQTPLHYFQNTQIVSGEALRSAEAPLTKKVTDRQMAFGSTWRDIFRFALLIEGIESDVQIRWQSVEAMESQDAWEIASIKKTLGMPTEQILFEMGYDREVIEDILKKMEEEKEKLRKEAEEAAKNGTPVATSDPGSLSTGMNAHNLALQQAAQQRKAAEAQAQPQAQ